MEVQRKLTNLVTFFQRKYQNKRGKRDLFIKYKRTPRHTIRSDAERVVSISTNMCYHKTALNKIGRVCALKSQPTLLLKIKLFLSMQSLLFQEKLLNPKN